MHEAHNMTCKTGLQAAHVLVLGEGSRSTGRVAYHNVCSTCPWSSLPWVLRKVLQRSETRAKAGACVANSVISLACRCLLCMSTDNADCAEAPKMFSMQRVPGSI